MALSRYRIDNYAQNKPTLVARDICRRYPEVDEKFVHAVLLKRGVYKWLAARRDLIRLKESWKGDVSALNRKKTPREKGFHAALEKCRQEIRRICRSPRWRAPDNDRHAQRFLKGAE